MDNEQEYVTITQVAKDLKWNKATVYDWIKTLGMEKHRFLRNKNTYLHITDVARLREIKEKPWTAGPNIARTARRVSEKGEKQPASTSAVQTSPVTEQPQKRKYKPRETGLPEGCILATDFARAHGVAPTTFIDHMLIGLGPGTVAGEQTDPVMVVKDHVEYSERVKPGRKRKTADGRVIEEKEKYLTQEQQKAALEFWQRHGVAFTQCENTVCWCHTFLEETE